MQHSGLLDTFSNEKLMLNFWLTASMKVTVFWDVARCSLIEINRRFGDVYCLNHHYDDGGIKHS
jgi:hypothetical protein